MHGFGLPACPVPPGSQIEALHDTTLALVVGSIRLWRGGTSGCGSAQTSRLGGGSLETVSVASVDASHVSD